MPETPHDLLTRLFIESRDALHRYVRRLVPSKETTEEIVQEAYLRTFEQADTLKTPRAFLLSTARNLATDNRRHARNVLIDQVGDFDDSGVVGADGPIENLLIADEASRILKQAIDRLPPHYNSIRSNIRKKVPTERICIPTSQDSARPAPQRCSC